MGRLVHGVALFARGRTAGGIVWRSCPRRAATGLDMESRPEGGIAWNGAA